jgi:hypothetical protein
MKSLGPGVGGVLAAVLASSLVGCSSAGSRHAVAPPPDRPEVIAPTIGPPAAPSSPAEAAPARAISSPPLRRSSALLEEPYANISRRFDFSVGAAVLRNFDTTVRVFGPNGGGGGFLDLEDLLNVDDTATILRFDSTYSFNRKHSLMFTYYDLNRSGTTGINEDIDVGTITIPASDITTTFDTRIVKLAYRFNFVRDTRTVIGASFGLNYMGLDFGINSSLGGGFEESFRANLPLPLVGLHSQYALGEKWEMYSSIEFLQVDLGILTGYMRDVRLGINHSPFEHLGWGFGYNGFAVDARFDASDNLDAEVEYQFQGFLLYLRTFF